MKVSISGATSAPVAVPKKKNLQRRHSDIAIRTVNSEGTEAESGDTKALKRSSSFRTGGACVCF
jgi:hypothetical protein